MLQYQQAIDAIRKILADVNSIDEHAIEMYDTLTALEKIEEITKTLP